MTIAVEKVAKTGIIERTIEGVVYQGYYGKSDDKDLRGCIIEMRVPMEALLKNGVQKELLLNTIFIISSNYMDTIEKIVLY